NQVAEPVPDSAIIKLLARHPDGISAVKLCIRLMTDWNCTRPHAQQAIRRLIDRGMVYVGKDLRLFPPEPHQGQEASIQTRSGNNTQITMTLSHDEWEKIWNAINNAMDDS